MTHAAAKCSLVKDCFYELAGAIGFAAPGTRLRPDQQQELFHCRSASWLDRKEASSAKRLRGTKMDTSAPTPPARSAVASSDGATCDPSAGASRSAPTPRRRRWRPSPLPHGRGRHFRAYERGPPPLPHRARLRRHRDTAAHAAGARRLRARRARQGPLKDSWLRWVRLALFSQKKIASTT